MMPILNFEMTHCLIYLGSGSVAEVAAGTAWRQNAGIGSKLISKTTGYLFWQQLQRRRRPFGDGRPVEESQSSCHVHGCKDSAM